MANTQLFVNINAPTVESGLVRGLTDNTPVSFPELVLGDSRSYDLYFVDGQGNYVSWSGNASYIPELAIGACGYPTGGTFTLTFGSQTTSALAWNATASQVQTALQALSSIGSGNCTVTGQGPNYFVVTFVGALAAAPQALITVNFSNLTPASNCNVFTLVAGTASPPVNAVQVLNFAINPISFSNSFTTITNGWTGQLSTATVAALAAFAAAGASLSETFQVSVLNPSGISTTYVKASVTIECTIINPTAYAGTNQPTLATQAALSAAVLGLNNFTQQTIAASSAGNFNVTPATTSRLHSALVALSGAAGTYSFSLVSSGSQNAGDKIFVVFNTPATAALVLNVYNASTSGTLLATVTTTVDQEQFFMVFEWNGTAFVLDFNSASLLAKVGNLAGISSPIAARLNLKALFATSTTKNTAFTIGSGEDGTYYGITTPSGAVLATLPSAATVGAGFLVCLQKTDSTTNAVTTSPATATLSQGIRTIGKRRKQEDRRNGSWSGHFEKDDRRARRKDMGRIGIRQRLHFHLLPAFHVT